MNMTDMTLGAAAARRGVLDRHRRDPALEDRLGFLADCAIVRTRPAMPVEGWLLIYKGKGVIILHQGTNQMIRQPYPARAVRGFICSIPAPSSCCALRNS